MAPLVRSAQHARRHVRATASAVPRRAVLATAPAVAAILAARPARALLDYDDEDEELLNKMRTTRREAVKRELASEKAFLKDEGLASRDLRKEVAVVQLTINTLSQAGALIESNDAPAVAELLGDAAWVGRFSEAAARISAGGELDAATRGLKELAGAAAKGAPLKATFVKSVSAFEAWAKAAGVQTSLSGL